MDLEVLYAVLPSECKTRYMSKQKLIACQEIPHLTLVCTVHPWELPTEGHSNMSVQMDYLQCHDTRLQATYV